MKHICLVGNVYYYRLRVPQDLLIHFAPSKELKRSLRTKSLGNAKRLTNLYDVEADTLFSRIRSNVLTNDEIKKLVREFTNDILEYHEEIRTVSGHQLSNCGAHFESNVPYSELIEIAKTEMFEASYETVKWTRIILKSQPLCFCAQINSRLDISTIIN